MLPTSNGENNFKNKKFLEKEVLTRIFFRCSIGIYKLVIKRYVTSSLKTS